MDEPKENGESAWRDDEDGGETYLNDSIQFLRIYPAEVWEVILVHTNDPRDLESLCNASPFFRKILFERRVLFLFPQVLMIIGDSLLDTMKSEFSISKWSGTVDNAENCAACGKTRKKYWYSALLSLRLVSPFWCLGVDKLCGRDLLDGRSINNWTEAYFKEETDVSQCLQHFCHTHDTDTGLKNIGGGRSPFLTGCVRLQYGHEFHPEEVNFLKLLSLYGQHILCFTIHDSILFPHVDGLPWTFTRRYSEIRQFLEFMPRLRKFPHFVNDQNHEKAVHEKKTELFPLPSIKSLEFMSTNFWSPIFSELVRSNSHMTMLETIIMSDESYRDLSTALQSLHLKEFIITFHSKVVPKLEMLENASWSLRKLHLNFSGDYFDWSEVYRGLGNKAWQETLTDVKLEMPGNINYESVDNNSVDNSILRECLEFRLHLFRVERFEIHTCYLCSIDFLLPMKDTLQNLKIVIKLAYKRRPLDRNLLGKAVKHQVIQFVGYSEKMYESNIWTLFPKLKLMNCSVGRNTSSYSRQKLELIRFEARLNNVRMSTSPTSITTPGFRYVGARENCKQR